MVSLLLRARLGFAQPAAPGGGLISRQNIRTQNNKAFMDTSLARPGRAPRIREACREENPSVSSEKKNEAFTEGFDL